MPSSSIAMHWKMVGKQNNTTPRRSQITLSLELRMLQKRCGTMLTMHGIRQQQKNNIFPRTNILEEFCLESVWGPRFPGPILAQRTHCRRLQLKLQRSVSHCARCGTAPCSIPIQTNVHATGVIGCMCLAATVTLRCHLVISDQQLKHIIGINHHATVQRNTAWWSCPTHAMGKRGTMQCWMQQTMPNPDQP